MGAKNRRLIGFYVFCAVATVVKGPAGLVLPGLIAGVYLLLSGRPRRVLELVSPVGLGLFVLIAAPWYVAAGLREPGFFDEFFIRQNVQRYAFGGFGHHIVGLLFAPIVLVGLLPWTGFVPAACARYFPRRWMWGRHSCLPLVGQTSLSAKIADKNVCAPTGMSAPPDRPEVLLLWVATFVTILFFSFSRTGLVSYILPAYPPAAVLVGAAIGDWLDRRDSGRLASLGAWSAAVLVAAFAATAIGFEVRMGIADGWMAVFAAAELVALVAMVLALMRGKRRWFAGCAVAGIVAVYLFVIGHTLPPGYERLNKWENPAHNHRATTPSNPVHRGVGGDNDAANQPGVRDAAPARGSPPSSRP